MKGPIPTIAFIFSATASVRPSPRSSWSSGRGVDIGGGERAKHIRYIEGAEVVAWSTVHRERPISGEDAASRMMQNVRGAKGAHAEARNCSDGRDGDDPGRRIF